MKFQAIICPNGLIISFEGPYFGSINDARLYTESQAIDRIKQLHQVESIRNNPIYLLGDSVYYGRFNIIIPFRRIRQLTRDQI